MIIKIRGLIMIILIICNPEEAKEPSRGIRMGRMSCAKAHGWPGFWRFHELPTRMLVCWNAGLGPTCCWSLPGIEHGFTTSNY